MKKMIPLVFVMVALLVVPLTGMAEEQVDMEAAKTAFEEICSKCHGLDRPLGKSKDQAGWEKTVTRMSGYHKRFGGPIDDATQMAIIQYLLENAGK